MLGLNLTTRGARADNTEGSVTPTRPTTATADPPQTADVERLRTLLDRQPSCLMRIGVSGTLLAVSKNGGQMIRNLAFLLTGLTTEAEGTNNPESARADDRYTEAFPPELRSIVTDVVVVRSATLTVDDPEFERYMATSGTEFGELASPTVFQRFVDAGQPVRQEALRVIEVPPLEDVVFLPRDLQ